MPLLDAGVPDAGTVNPMSPCVGSYSGTERECGWTSGRALACTPGRTITVGCNSNTGADALCTPTLGACTGDPVIRVCAGTAPCSAATALIAEDDTCGTCPVTSTTCPSSGSVYVLSGPFDNTRAGTCSPALR
jgi:hypothetical protein